MRPLFLPVSFFLRDIKNITGGTHILYRFYTKRITLDRRKSAVIMYDDIGAVFVEESGVCERVKISETTKNMLTFAIDDII